MKIGYIFMIAYVTFLYYSWIVFMLFPPAENSCVGLHASATFSGPSLGPSYSFSKPDFHSFCFQDFHYSFPIHFFLSIVSLSIFLLPNSLCSITVAVFHFLVEYNLNIAVVLDNYYIIPIYIKGACKHWKIFYEYGSIINSVTFYIVANI